jgi:hypothetical protein
VSSVAVRLRSTMSLQVNISSKEILTAYQAILNGETTNWALFTYDKGSNDLKLQSSGDGGLEELEEEFSDGRSVISNRLKSQLIKYKTIGSNMPLPELKTQMSAVVL